LSGGEGKESQKGDPVPCCDPHDGCFWKVDVFVKEIELDFEALEAIIKRIEIEYLSGCRKPYPQY
jgi:hypothetical protein